MQFHIQIVLFRRKESRLAERGQGNLRAEMVLSFGSPCFFLHLT